MRRLEPGASTRSILGSELEIDPNPPSAQYSRCQVVVTQQDEHIEPQFADRRVSEAEEVGEDPLGPLGLASG